MAKKGEGLQSSLQTLCIDFDGVIHSYERGWQAGIIYGSVVPGFWQWADEAQKLFNLVVYSSRSKDIFLRNSMQLWMQSQWEMFANLSQPDFTMPVFEYASQKPPAYLTIDDRAICFNGNWSDPSLVPSTMIKFKPWNAKGK